MAFYPFSLINFIIEYLFKYKSIKDLYKWCTEINKLGLHVAEDILFWETELWLFFGVDLSLSCEDLL